MSRTIDTIKRYFNEQVLDGNPMKHELAIRQSDYTVIDVTETECESYTQGYEDGFKKALEMYNIVQENAFAQKDKENK